MKRGVAGCARDWTGVMSASRVAVILVMKVKVLVVQIGIGDGRLSSGPLDFSYKTSSHDSLGLTEIPSRTTLQTWRDLTYPERPRTA